MTDLTKNERPLGLLTDEDREIFYNWPHGIEVFLNDGWEKSALEILYNSRTYRLIPAPKRVVRWQNVYQKHVYGTLHKSREQADAHAIPNRLCVHRIEMDEDGRNPTIEWEAV